MTKESKAYHAKAQSSPRKPRATFFVLLCGLCATDLFSIEPVKSPEPAPVTDSQARSIREAQLAVAMAIINKTEAEKAGQKAIDDAQVALQAKVLELQKAAHCDGCGLTKDLKWERPAK